MEIKNFISIIVEENCYVISEKNECIIIDPGAGVQDDVNKYIDENNLKLKAVLLTHGHFDHIWDVPFFSDVKNYCHKADEYFIKNPTYKFGNSLAKDVNSAIGRNDLTEPKIVNTEFFDIAPQTSKNYKIGEFALEFISMPGHSPGSTLYKIGNDVFCGDVIFQNSTGRTDIYLSEPSQMRKSLEKIMKMDDNLHFYSGHENDLILKDWKKFFNYTVPENLR